MRATAGLGSVLYAVRGSSILPVRIFLSKSYAFYMYYNLNFLSKHLILYICARQLGWDPSYMR